jgi:nitroreductase/NAD-dependent dihydropyrimidine dehydrogenase PreA subunit
MPWEDVKDILRPNMDDIHMGVMKVDEDKCNKCELCMQNCPFQCWEKNEEGYPILKENYACFSCYNCKIACPNNAISIIDSYHVDAGVFRTEPYPLPPELPLEPKDIEGNPAEWNEFEKLVFTRRSVRNFKEISVPESIIQRILEAGRFAPSGGNCQPWKFVVITNKEMIKEIDKAGVKAISQVYNAYTNDTYVKSLEGMVTGPPPSVGSADPRIIFGGLGTVSKEGGLAPSLNAPAIILLLADERSIGNPQISIGICGQTMNLVANSLGIKATWSGFFAWGANVHPTLKKELGIEPPWICVSSLCLGYPKFKQEGIVPRERRPVKWFREDKDKSTVPERTEVPQAEKQEV